MTKKRVKSCYNCVSGELYLNNQGEPYAYCWLDIGDKIAEPELEASRCSFYTEDGIDEFEEWKKKSEQA